MHRISTCTGYQIKLQSNCRIPGHSFICHWIRIASIVLCLNLQSLPTHVSEADQSGQVFCSLAKTSVPVARTVTGFITSIFSLQNFFKSFTLWLSRYLLIWMSEICNERDIRNVNLVQAYSILRLKYNTTCCRETTQHQEKLFQDGNNYKYGRYI